MKMFKGINNYVVNCMCVCVFVCVCVCVYVGGGAHTHTHTHIGFSHMPNCIPEWLPRSEY